MDHGDVYETVLNELKTTSPEVITLTIMHTYRNLRNLLSKSIPDHPLYQSDSLCLYSTDINEFKENLVNQAWDIVKLRNDKVIDFKGLYTSILKEIYSTICLLKYKPYGLVDFKSEPCNDNEKDFKAWMKTIDSVLSIHPNHTM